MDMPFILVKINFRKTAYFCHFIEMLLCNLEENMYSVHEYDFLKVSKGAKIRNRYNQVPHLTQDTNGKVTNSQ